MFQAIKRNKAGRNFQDATDWRSLFGASEDSLTSCVFGHLFYLPAAMVWALLQDSAYQLQLPESIEAPVITSYDFWPHWPAALTRNANYVEPDVFVRTASFDLILEAKRYDYDQQDCAQWQDQLQAYLNEFGDETLPGEHKQPVLLLAMGGIQAGDELPTQICCSGTTATVYRCRWINLLNSIQTLRTQLNAGQEHLGHILTDIVHSFGLHGYTTRPLLNTLPLPLQSLQQGVGLSLFLRHSASVPTQVATS
ncbi:MAG: hypothetical protein EOO61_06475 [Hymenobacter sp.]|nr:MAG: hypothetical protein EOO61_06475 [Hymenobacter sp.]